MDIDVIPQVIYEHREPWWNYVDRVKLLIRPPELSGNYKSESSGSKQEERTKGMMNLSLRSSFIHTFK
jgi:hypothetical protein